MSSLINKKIFKIAVFGFILAEILSYIGFKIPALNTGIFIVLIIAVLILSLKKLEYGLYAIFAELFIGSKGGYLFSLVIGGATISLRMGVFMVVMGVFTAYVILNGPRKCGGSEESRDKKEKPLNKVLLFFHGIPHPSFAKDGFGMTLTLLTTIIVWAFLWGLIRGNGFQNVFFDFNNWLYFLIVLPVIFIFKGCHSERVPRIRDDEESRGISHLPNQKQNEFLTNIISILCAAVIVIFLKTIILFYLFTHGLAFIGSDIYKWVRDTGVGEIAILGGGLVRIFMQSQIYSLLLFLIIFICHSSGSWNPEKNILKFLDPDLHQDDRKIGNTEDNQKNDNSDKKELHITHYTLLITSMAIIILSLSRSYWFGLICALIIYFFYSLFIIHNSLFTFLKTFSKLCVLVIISIGIILVSLYLPPKQSYDFSVLIAKRGISGEPASTSRINQLKPLLLAIAKHPVIGSGFGATVSYKSDDPRAIQASQNNSGLISTYAFEWGYLDMALKFGALGLFIYLFIIFKILKKFFKFEITNSKFETNSNIKIQNLKDINHNTLYIIHYTFSLALIALLVVNIFSPYLNHPLGIGFIILIFILCQTKK